MKQLIRTDQILHNWERIIGRIGKLYIPQQPDDSNSNFIWNETTKVLQGRDFKTENGLFKIVFSVYDAQFQFLNNQNATVYKVETDSRSTIAIIEDIKTFLKEQGLNVSNFDKELKFRFPEHIDGNHTMPLLNKEALKRWDLLRTGANKAISNTLNQINKKSEIVLWPTNFDTGIYCEYDGNIEQYAGFAPADEVSDSPYFYNSFYKNGKPVQPINLEKLPEGIWKHDTWNGAILPISSFSSDTTFLAVATPFLVKSTQQLLTSIKEK
tara:strand:- start:127381 stop:128184 length:804 start_codon:yes stop_codon:yes gene_type:complete